MTANSTATVATDDGSYAGFVLAQLACAGLRTRLQTCEIDSIATALRGNFIDADEAIAWAHEIGALHLIAISLTTTST